MSRKPVKRKANQPVRGGLKGFADAKKTNIDILRDVRTHVVAQGVKTGDADREPHLIHVSDVIKDDSCPRKMYYKITETPTSDAKAPSYHRLEMMWAAGHDTHHKWQRWLWEMGDLWGSWKCLSCGNQWKGLAPTECGNCESTALEYKEVNLADKDMYLVGHADGAVPRLNTLIEIKSFSSGTVRIENPGLVAEHTHKVDGKTVVDHDGVWKAIKRPLRSHIHQGMFYLWMAAKMGLPYDRIIYIYENKTSQDTKTFEVKLSTRFIQEFIDTLEEVAVFAAEGIPPSRPTLFAKGSKPCNACPFRTTCWGDDGGTGEETTSGVSASGSGVGGSEEGGGPAVPPAPASEPADPTGPRRRNRPARSRTDRDDDQPDSVGRASRRAVGAGGGRREVRRSRDGQGESTGVSRQGSRRDRAQGEGVRGSQVRRG